MRYGFRAFAGDFLMIFERSLFIRRSSIQSPKRRNFVHTHDGRFVQCVSPRLFSRAINCKTVSENLNFLTINLTFTWIPKWMPKPGSRLPSLDIHLVTALLQLSRNQAGKNNTS